MKFIFSIIILGVLLGSCGKERKPNVEKLLKSVQIGRLDQDLFALDTINPDLTGLQTKYGAFLDTYTLGVLNIGPVTDTNFVDWLKYFIKDPVIREVADSVAVAYPDLKKQERQLTWAWAYYTYYFPKRLIPRVYTYISGFNQSVVIDSTAVGIGLDNYLGEHCAFYNVLSIPVPMYARKKMTDQDIVRDVVGGWLNAEFTFQPLQNDLVSGMIYQGKMIYLLEKLFPDAPKSWLLGFTLEQEKWCVNNEAQIWGFLIENKYLFSTQQRMIMKYLNDAPFTSGMPVESPGRAVVWTGFQIVKKYMEKADISQESLMEEQDYHKILRVAGYRP